MQNNIIELSSGSSSSDDDAEQLLFQQKPKCTNNGYQRVEHKVKQRNKNARPGTSHQMDEERTSAPLPATASVTSTTTNAPITPNQKNIAGNFLFKNTDKQTTLINFIESKVKDELEKQMGDFKKKTISYQRAVKVLMMKKLRLHNWNAPFASILLVSKSSLLQNVATRFASNASKKRLLLVVFVHRAAKKHFQTTYV